MKLSSKETTSLRAMVELARQYGSGPTSLHEVARAQGLSQAYLEHIAAELRRAGLVRSIRGACGGYELVSAPSDVTVADVLDAVEDGLLPLDCIKGNGATCERELFCASRSVWLVVEQRLRETLTATTLADLIE